MSATYDIDDDDDRKRFKRFLIVSAAAHGMLLLFLAVSPSFSPAPDLSAAIMVDLVAPPGPPPAAKAASTPRPAKPVPAPPAPPVVKEAPVPPPPAPPPPVAKPAPPTPPKAETVLPKEAVKAPEQVKPAPPPTKPAPAAPPQPAAKPPPPQKQASIDDVLSQMRAEAGESAPTPIEDAGLAPADVSGTGGGSVKVSPEVMAWLKSARIHVRKSWVLVPGFRLEPLSTQVRVNLDSAGNVVGEVVIVRKSGNPWYDDSVLRAIQKASPLPAPPKAGEWVFLFQPEES